MSQAIALNMQISASTAGLQKAVAQTERLLDQLTADTQKTQKSLSQAGRRWSASRLGLE